MAYRDRFGWPKSETVATRKARATRKAAELTRRGHSLQPITLEGKIIAHTFWGRSWCQNLESYSDFANRLGRGRSYVRHGSVIDLQLSPGTVLAQVQGSALYRVEVHIAPVCARSWLGIRKECAGHIDSVVELLSGRLSRGVMEILCRKDGGLFPAPAEITFSCSCPDAAGMCKHIAAVLYGVGARLDQSPELLFTLRGADQLELVSAADSASYAGAAAVDSPLGDLGEMFGIELAPQGGVPRSKSPKPRPARPRKPKKARGVRR